MEIVLDFLADIVANLLALGHPAATGLRLHGLRQGASLGNQAAISGLLNCCTIEMDMHDAARRGRVAPHAGRRHCDTALGV